MRTFIGLFLIFYHLSWIASEEKGCKEKGPKQPYKFQKKEVDKPHMPESYVNKYKQQFTPAWMDYCDPIHCNDYHKAACGVNRRNMRFKWFQSACHIRLNNICAVERGNLKYDWTLSKFCTIYVMYWRSGCPKFCEPDVNVICGVNLYDNHLALFRNKCAMERANCNAKRFHEYEEINMEFCSYYLNEDKEYLRKEKCPAD